MGGSRVLFILFFLVCPRFGGGIENHSSSNDGVDLADDVLLTDEQIAHRQTTDELSRNAFRKYREATGEVPDEAGYNRALENLKSKADELHQYFARGEKIPKEYFIETFRTAFHRDPSPQELGQVIHSYGQAKNEFISKLGSRTDGAKGKENAGAKSGSDGDVANQNATDILNSFANGVYNTPIANSASGLPKESNTLDAKNEVSGKAAISNSVLPNSLVSGTNANPASRGVLGANPFSFGSNIGNLNSKSLLEGNSGLLSNWGVSNQDGFPKISGSEAASLLKGGTGAQFRNELNPVSLGLPNWSFPSLDDPIKELDKEGSNTGYGNSFSFYGSNYPSAIEPRLLDPDSLLGGKDSLSNPSDPNKYKIKDSEIASTAAALLGSGTSFASITSSGGSTPSGSSAGSAGSLIIGRQGSGLPSTPATTKPEIVTTFGKLFSSLKDRLFGGDVGRDIASRSESEESPTLMGASLLSVEKTWKGFFGDTDTEKLSGDSEKSGDPLEQSGTELGLGYFIAFVAALVFGATYRRYRADKRARLAAAFFENEDLKKVA